MRRFILTVAFCTLAPVAFAETQQGTAMQDGAPTTNRPVHRPAAMAQQTGENCGTPDEFKPCPPLPRHPMQYYPANRK